MKLSHGPSNLQPMKLAFCSCFLAFLTVVVFQVPILHHSVSSSGASRRSPLSSVYDVYSEQQCLIKQFKRYGSVLTAVKLNLDFKGSHSSHPEFAVVAVVSEDDWCSKTWQNYRKQEGIPYVLFTARGNVRNNELEPRFARLPAVLATLTCMPHIQYLIYKDLDTLIDFRKALIIAHKTARPIVMPWMKWGNAPGKVLIPNWFVVRAEHPESAHFLTTWYYIAEPQQIKPNETALNSLYITKAWVRDVIHGLWLPSIPGLELRHCHKGTTKERMECMLTLKLVNYK